MNKTEYLEIGCLVTHRDDLDLRQQGSLRWCRVAGPPEGTKKLSQFFIELDKGSSGNVSFAESEVVLYLISGHVLVNIAGREFPAQEGCGVHIRSGEAFSLQNACDSKLCMTATVCPAKDEFQLIPDGLTGFDERYSNRVIDAGQSKQQASGDRFYRLLVGPQTQSKNVTQFIGMIPQSKAPEHFHLYEEVI